MPCNIDDSHHLFGNYMSIDIYFVNKVALYFGQRGNNGRRRGAIDRTQEHIGIQADAAWGGRTAAVLTAKATYIFSPAYGQTWIQQMPAARTKKAIKHSVVTWE